MNLVQAMKQKIIRMRVWFAIFAFVAGGQSAKAQTWVQWKSADGGNDHFYALTPAATNWIAAEELAVSWGGTLATITSSNEQQFIDTTFLTGAFEHLPLWIGLQKAGAGGSYSGQVGSLHIQVGLQPGATAFRWVTDEPFSYSNWKSGEPSDAPPGENYVAINWEYSDLPPRGIKGDWNDTPQEGTSGYGGKTDGPYFGLVERDSDPKMPIKIGFNWRLASLVLALIGLVVFCFVSFRKKRKEVITPQPISSGN